VIRQRCYSVSFENEEEGNGRHLPEYVFKIFILFLLENLKIIFEWKIVGKISHFSNSIISQGRQRRI